MSTQDQTTANQTVAPEIDSRIATHDILDTMAADGRFSGILRAVHAAGMDAYLRNPELITVFVPPDQAAGQLPQDHDALLALLSRHIVKGVLSVADLNTTQQVKTVGGDMLPVRLDNGQAFVGGARIIDADISCTNGMLHVVEGPLQAK